MKVEEQINSKYSFVSSFLHEKETKWKSMIQRIYHSVYFKYFWILFLIYIIALIPLFLAHFNYIDDLGRSVLGARNFNFNRILSDFLAIFIHGGGHITDISPWTQMIAVLFMAMGSTILIKIFSLCKEEKIRISYLFASIPFAISPYFMENLSYKYDAPYMALSVLLCVVPFLFYHKETKNKKSNIIYFLVSSICIFGMCTTYQSSSGIYPSIAVMLTLSMILSKVEWKEILKFVLLSMLAYFTGLLCFQLIPMTSPDHYVNPSLLPIGNLLSGSIQNYQTYFSLFQSDFTKLWKILIVGICFFFLLSSTIHTKNNHLVSFGSSIFSLILLALLSLGVYPFMVSPLTNPRAMYGIFVSLSLFGMMIARSKYFFLSKLCLFLFAYSIFVFSLTYGNALAEQKRYTDFRVGLVIQDLNEIEVGSNQVLLVDIDGTIGQPDTVDSMSRRYPVLKRLIPETFGDNLGWWNAYYFYHYFHLPRIENSLTEYEKEEMHLIKGTRYHDIYQKENQILIELKS